MQKQQTRKQVRMCSKSMCDHSRGWDPYPGIFWQILLPIMQPQKVAPEVLLGLVSVRGGCSSYAKIQHFSQALVEYGVDFSQCNLSLIHI
eukprot:2386282-Amphidinium_carterae.1